MPQVSSLAELKGYGLHECELISIFDPLAKKIMSQNSKFPFMFAIFKDGATPVNRYVSDVKTRYGRNHFGIPSERQIVLFFYKYDDDKFCYNSIDGKEYIFESDDLFVILA